MNGVSYEDLYHQASVGLISTDGDDVIVAVNDTFLEWSGHSSANILGVRFRDVLTKPSQIFYETRYQPVLRLGGIIREVALELVRADGTTVPILVNARFPGGIAAAGSIIQIAIFDSTQRQNYERELLTARRAAEVSEERVRTLQNASSSFLVAETEEALAEALVKIARDAFSAADAAVLFSDSVGSLRVLAGHHLEHTLLRLQAARGEPASAPAREVAHVDGLDMAAQFSQELADTLREIRMEAVSSAALVGADGPFGSLLLFYGRKREFDEATLELHRALARQASIVLDRIRLQRELQRLALHDQLTGLANRSLLSERLSHTLAQAERTGRAMSLLFLDLDGFKEINDDLGHRVGDDVLQATADRINSVVREADIVGRFGGDEFLIVCEDADERAAVLIAERVAAAIAEPLDDIEVGRQLTASIGLAVFHPGDHPAPSNDAIVRAADAAMYESKKAGPSRITIVRV